MGTLCQTIGSASRLLNLAGMGPVLRGGTLSSDRGTSLVFTPLLLSTLLSLTMARLWTTDVQLSVGGSASLTYSSEALVLADSLQPNGFLPHRVQLVSWKEYR